MYRILFLSILVCVCLSASSAVANSVEFEGRFSSIQSSAKECEAIFQQRNYRTKHFWLELPGLISVLYFEDDDPGGFFSGMSLVGNYGGSGDIYAEKRLEIGERLYSIVSRGIVDWNVLYVVIEVKMMTLQKEPICEAVAEYTGFNR